MWPNYSRTPEASLYLKPTRKPQMGQAKKPNGQQAGGSRLWHVIGYTPNTD